MKNANKHQDKPLTLQYSGHQAQTHTEILTAKQGPLTIAALFESRLGLEDIGPSEYPEGTTGNQIHYASHVLECLNHEGQLKPLLSFGDIRETTTTATFANAAHDIRASAMGHAYPPAHLIAAVAVLDEMASPSVKVA